MRPQLTLLVVIRALRIRGFPYQPSLFSLLQDSKYKGTEYYNFVFNIPNEIIEKPRWIEGQEVPPEVKGDLLILEGVNPNLFHL